MSSAQRWITDEDFDNDVLRGLVRRLPELDVLRVQDVGLAGAADPVILEWAAQQGRILLTHDAKTMPDHAYARLRAGQRISGVCIIPQAVPIGQAIEELIFIIECSFRAHRLRPFRGRRSIFALVRDYVAQAAGDFLDEVVREWNAQRPRPVRGRTCYNVGK